MVVFTFLRQAQDRPCGPPFYPPHWGKRGERCGCRSRLPANEWQKNAETYGVRRVWECRRLGRRRGRLFVVCFRGRDAAAGFRSADLWRYGWQGRDTAVLVLTRKKKAYILNLVQAEPDPICHIRYFTLFLVFGKKFPRASLYGTNPV